MEHSQLRYLKMESGFLLFDKCSNSDRQYRRMFSSPRWLIKPTFLMACRLRTNWRGANRASNKLASPRLGSHNFSKLNAM